MKDVDDPTYQILLARAKTLAQRGQVSTRKVVGEPVAVLLVGGEAMGIPVSYLQSVIRRPSVTLVPHLPPWLPGVIQLRGIIVSVVDIARWLGLPTQNEAPYLAVLKNNVRLLGMLVDGVAGVREIFEDELVEQQAVQRNVSDLPIRYTTRDLVAVLDVERVFVLADQRATHAQRSLVPTPGALS